MPSRWHWVHPSHYPSTFQPARSMYLSTSCTCSSWQVCGNALCWQKTRDARCGPRWHPHMPTIPVAPLTPLFPPPPLPPHTQNTLTTTSNSNTHGMSLCQRMKAGPDLCRASGRHHSTPAMTPRVRTHDACTLFAVACLSRVRRQLAGCTPWPTSPTPKEAAGPPICVIQHSPEVCVHSDMVSLGGALCSDADAAARQGGQQLVRHWLPPLLLPLPTWRLQCGQRHHPPPPARLLLLHMW